MKASNFAVNYIILKKDIKGNSSENIFEKCTYLSPTDEVNHIINILFELHNNEDIINIEILEIKSIKEHMIVEEHSSLLFERFLVN